MCSLSAFSSLLFLSLRFCSARSFVLPYFCNTFILATFELCYKSRCFRFFAALQLSVVVLVVVGWSYHFYLSLLSHILFSMCYSPVGCEYKLISVSKTSRFSWFCSFNSFHFISFCFYIFVFISKKHPFVSIAHILHISISLFYLKCQFLFVRRTSLIKIEINVLTFRLTLYYLWF